MVTFSKFYVTPWFSCHFHSPWHKWSLWINLNCSINMTFIGFNIIGLTFSGKIVSEKCVLEMFKLFKIYTKLYKICLKELILDKVIEWQCKDVLETDLLQWYLKSSCFVLRACFNEPGLLTIFVYLCDVVF